MAKNVKLIFTPDGLKFFNLKSIPSKTKPKSRVPEVLELKKQGLKQKEIADKLGISPGYVSKLLKNNGD